MQIGVADCKCSTMFLKEYKKLYFVVFLLFPAIVWSVYEVLKITEYKDYQFRIETDIPVFLSDCVDPLTHYHIGKVSQDSWSSVNNDTFMFSAYHDDAFNKTIRIIGIKPQNNVRYYCQLWYRNNNINTTKSWSKIEIQATTRKMDWYPVTYTHVDAYFICPLPNNNHPDKVSLVTQKCSYSSNWLSVRYNHNPNQYKRQVTVCLSPLHNRYNNTYQLIEWIELNRILGVQKFIVYNFKSAENIGEVLQSYSMKKIITVIQWNLPRALNNVSYFGQVAALNDCLYRNKGISEYVVSLDLDEFVIPHNQLNTLPGMLKTLPESGIYRFQNRFFRHNWNRANNEFEGKELAKQFHLASLLNIERESEVTTIDHRMKYIARTEVAHTMMQHYVNELSQGQSILHVNPEIGLLHHYRNEEKERDEKKRITDNTVVSKYKDVLIKNVAEMWSMYNKTRIG